MAGRMRGKVPAAHRVSRAKVKELELLTKKKAEKAKQGTSAVKIQRTVEMIDQSSEDWRNEKSKLMFMVGIGLTPIEGRDALKEPKVVISRIPEKEFKTYKEKYDNEQIQHRRAQREERLRRIREHRGWRTGLEPEVIDLCSDDEASKQGNLEDPEESENAIFIPQSMYPYIHLSILKPPTPQSSMEDSDSDVEIVEISNENQAPLHKSIQKEVSRSPLKQNTNFAEPKVVLRVGFDAMGK